MLPPTRVCASRPVFPPVLLVCVCSVTGLQPPRFRVRVGRAVCFRPGAGVGTGGISRPLCWSGCRRRYVSVCVSMRTRVHACVHSARPLCGVCSGSGLLQSHIPPAPLCLCYKKYLHFPRLIIFPPQSLPDVSPVVPVPMATEVPAAAVPFCGACPGSWRCCRATVGEWVSGRAGVWQLPHQAAT